MKNFKGEVDRIGTTAASGKIKYLNNLLRGEAFQTFDKLASQDDGTYNAHLKFIQEGLLSNFFLINAFSKHILGGNGSVEKMEVVVKFRETGGKALERDVSMFTHFTDHRAILIGKGVDKEKFLSKPSWMSFKCALYVPAS